jgi:hypothetical protein
MADEAHAPGRLPDRLGRHDRELPDEAAAASRSVGASALLAQGIGADRGGMTESDLQYQQGEQPTAPPDVSG